MSFLQCLRWHWFNLFIFYKLWEYPSNETVQLLVRISGVILNCFIKNMCSYTLILQKYFFYHELKSHYKQAFVNSETIFWRFIWLWPFDANARSLLCGFVDMFLFMKHTDNCGHCGSNICEWKINMKQPRIEVAINSFLTSSPLHSIPVQEFFIRN